MIPVWLELLLLLLLHCLVSPRRRSLAADFFASGVSAARVLLRLLCVAALLQGCLLGLAS
jgi:hypothetical protein